MLLRFVVSVLCRVTQPDEPLCEDFNIGQQLSHNTVAPLFGVMSDVVVTLTIAVIHDSFDFFFSPRVTL